VSSPSTPGVSSALRIGNYTVLRRLAVGGMAELYLARAEGIEGFEKLVALKRILPQLAQDEDFVRMFLEEARLAAHLQHQNIAQVFDIGQDGASYFFAMEYVRGQDLRSIRRAAEKKGTTIPLEASLAIAIGACAGLHHAHGKADPQGRPLGIVHRDVSPSNVLVTYDGCVKIVDFGIAKASVRRSQTPAGTIKGKLAYMSPEQCQAEAAIDRRSDVFSVGILLYEMSTGTPLFRADTEWGIFRKIVFEDLPRPSTRRRGYPAALEAVVMRALARRPQDRYSSAQELQLALEGFAREHRIGTSNVLLARTMGRLFPRAETSTWKEARPIARVVARSPSEPPAGEAVRVRPPERRRWTRPLLGVAIAFALAGLVSAVGLVEDGTRLPELAPRVPAAPVASVSSVVAALSTNAVTLAKPKPHAKRIKKKAKAKKKRLAKRQVRKASASRQPRPSR
jgi:serine/threonine protein kinase